MFHRFCLTLLLTCIPFGSYAGIFSSSSEELRTVIAKHNVRVDNYTLPTDDLTKFYTARDFKPAWDFRGAENAVALDNFLTSLTKQIDYHGLNEANYPIALTKNWVASTDASASTKTELLVTSLLITLAHDLHGDSVDLNDLYPGWRLKREPLDIPNQLAGAVDKNELAPFLSSIAPTRAEYITLAQILADLRTLKSGGGWPQIAKGNPLRHGDKDARVPILRQRLVAENYLVKQTLLPEQELFFDAELEQGVKLYQTQNGLDTDGHVGEKTREALHTTIDDRINQVRANMERWRHVPNDFPPTARALINIANMTIDITNKSGDEYMGPVVVGRVDRKTPFIASEIHQMILNPSWHVPAKIARKDILPKLRKDPEYLEKLGISIKGNPDDPHGQDIDWTQVSDRAFNFQLRQAPGEQNSLGPLKLDFLNDFPVYMHGTPHQELFVKRERGFSSGCVRLRDPQRVAEIVFSQNKKPWHVADIDEGIASGKTKWIKADEPMPIFFLYWTVFKDKDGHINYRKDIYNYDQFLIETMDKK